MVATADERRHNYRENMQAGFDALVDLYYLYWGEFFHLAIFAPGEGVADYDTALARTHARYFHDINGATAPRILELACGGGAFSLWMAERASGEVVGVDLSRKQIAYARKRLARARQPNLRFLRHDIMRIADLNEEPFDAAICLDAACYLPDKRGALRGIAACLRPGVRFLLVDWCRAERATALQEELILEPFYRAWGIPAMETISGYRSAFAGAGLRLCDIDDLSDRVAPNWERGYRAALNALAEPLRPAQLLTMAATATRYGTRMIQVAKEQFSVALLAKAAAESGLLRYVAFLAERE